MSKALASSGFLPRWFPIPGIRFELPEDGGGGTALGDPPADPLADPADPPADSGGEGDPAPTDPAEAVAPQIDWNDPDIQARLGETTQAQVYALLEQLAQEGQQQPERIDPSQLDPFDENYSANLLQAFQQMLDERLGPVQNVVEEFQGERINGTITSVLGQGAEEFKVPESDRDFFATLADGMANRVQGEGMPAVQQAIKLAGEQYTAIVKREREAAVAAYREGVQGVAATPAEPGVGGAGVTFEQNGGSYDERFARVLARHGITD